MSWYRWKLVNGHWVVAEIPSQAASGAWPCYPTPEAALAVGHGLESRFLAMVGRKLAERERAEGGRGFSFRHMDWN